MGKQSCHSLYTRDLLISIGDDRLTYAVQRSMFQRTFMPYSAALLWSQRAQVPYNSEIPAEPATAVFDDLNDQSILRDQDCKFNRSSAYEQMRGTALTGAVLLCNVALRTGKKRIWGAKNLKAIGGPEADVFIRRPYREGWTL